MKKEKKEYFMRVISVCSTLVCFYVFSLKVLVQTNDNINDVAF